MKFDAYVDIYLTEAAKPFNPADYNLMPQKTKVSVIIGRFNPWTLGHNSLTDDAKHPVVIGLVKGKNPDKNKNPFEFELQKEIINRAGNPKIIDVVMLPTASIPFMINELRNIGLEPMELWCGTDRERGYQAQVDKYAEQMNSRLKLKVLQRNEEDSGVTGISATKVREAIRNGDFQATANMMSNIDEDLFNVMYQTILS